MTAQVHPAETDAERKPTDEVKVVKSKPGVQNPINLWDEHIAAASALKLDLRLRDKRGD